MEIKPIGQFHCNAIKNYDVPRQAFLNSEIGTVQLIQHSNFEQALQDLEGFSHVWLIYLFDNQKWKPKVQTPRVLKKKGVFSTRSPYRPNPIGISLVELIKIDGLNLTIKKFDLLNQTQILDIKPYLQQADSVDSAKEGWLEDVKEFNIKFTDQFYKDLITKSTESPNKVIDFINNQLKYCPLNHPNKRVKAQTEVCTYILSYGYLRILFKVESNEIIIQSLSDGQTSS